MHLVDLEAQALTLPARVDAFFAVRIAHNEVVGTVHERGQVDRAVGARDARGTGKRDTEGRLHHAELASGVVQHRGDLLVDAGRPDVPVGDHGVGPSECEEAQLHRIDAQVEERAATLREIEVAMRRVHRRAKTEVAFGEERLADSPGIQDVTERAVRRQEPRPHCLHDETVLIACRRRDLTRLRGVDRERLLAQDVLARGEVQQ